jgi:hypothetical protein
MPKPRWSLIVKLKSHFLSYTPDATSPPVSISPPLAAHATNPITEELKVAIMKKHRDWVTVGCKSGKAEVAAPLEEELLVLLKEAMAMDHAGYKNWVYEDWKWGNGEYDAM